MGVGMELRGELKVTALGNEALSGIIGVSTGRLSAAPTLQGTT